MCGNLVTVIRSLAVSVSAALAAGGAAANGDASSYVSAVSTHRSSCEGTGGSFEVTNKHGSRTVTANLKVSYPDGTNTVSSTFSTNVSPGQTWRTCTYVACVNVTTGCGFSKSYSLTGAKFLN